MPWTQLLPWLPLKLPVGGLCDIGRIEREGSVFLRAQVVAVDVFDAHSGWLPEFHVEGVRHFAGGGDSVIRSPVAAVLTCNRSWEVNGGHVGDDTIGQVT